MTLNDAIYQFAELGRGDDVKASQARQMAAWLKELRELRNKMRVLEPLFGKEQIESLRREVRQMRRAAEEPTPPLPEPPAVEKAAKTAEIPKGGLFTRWWNRMGRENAQNP